SYVLVFFFYILHPTTLSTLFPYTTLFRSTLFDSTFSLKDQIKVKTPKKSRSDFQRALLDSVEKLFRTAAKRKIEITAIGVGCAGDRKSTRLNSSHEWISYAVFCLKKKKKS